MEKYSCGRYALIDSDSLPLLSTFKRWWVKDSDLVFSESNGERVYIHRLIMGAKDIEVVDHINHNRLDNRRCNLRVCSDLQNQYNKLKRSDSVNKYKGVTKRRHGFSAECNGKYLGFWKKEEDAARAYNVEARSVFGDFACTNAINEYPEELWFVFPDKDKKKTSKYKNVHWKPSKKRWVSYVTRDGLAYQKHFMTEEEANTYSIELIGLLDSLEET